MTDKSAREPLSEEERREARLILRGKVEGKAGCVHCAGVHPTVRGLKLDRQPCPRVRRAVWHADGTLLEVEYWKDGEWDTSEVVTFGEAFEGWDGNEDEAEGVS